MRLNKTTPEDILALVDFNIEENNTWKYDKNNKDMYTYQAEGAAGIWNRLEHFGLAILADEVGMGKTYQALAVVTKQFKEKPDSKILIVTPRYEVLRQWKEEEYAQFKNHHLKDENLLPDKEELGELANLSDRFFSQEFETYKSKIIFAKTTSFQIDETKIKIDKCNEDAGKFDLIIIDEAHKFRNADKSVKRNVNAHEIFKDIKSKILLMTATPLHSRKSDILNIVNVFKPTIFTKFKIDADPDAIMADLMIRRLRVMSNNYNKYHYRREKEIAVEINTKAIDYKDELFFAMLQKKMVADDKNKINFSKSKNMLDLLEGTSFDEKSNKAEDEDQKKNKHETTTVKKIFNNVLDKFKDSYPNTLPSNQKYNEVLKHIDDYEEKALVFVRRRASAIELSRQYMEYFDKSAWKILSSEKRLPNKAKREEFDRLLGLNKVDKNIDKFIDKIAKIDEDYQFSKIYKDYLDTKQRYKSVQNIMASHFLELYDSLDNFYSNYEEFKTFINKEQERKNSKKEIGEYLPKSVILDFFKTKKGEVSTSASRFVRKFDDGKSYERFFTEWLPKKLDYVEQVEKYNLMKSAVLHASIGVVELFKCDIKPENYDSFCTKVSRMIDNSIFKREIQTFLENFDKYEKYLISNNNEGNTSDDKIDENLKVYNETIFYNAQPAYAYLSSTKNKSVIARFNSPFFPNLLCGTSTLQEGLNLHLQCNKIYHFGSAHTMGDDEQRIGRVDRIHGKMYRELEDNHEAKLHVHYPYLKNTFDEENLRNMLCSKRSTERKIDRCQIEANITNIKSIVTQNQCEKPIVELLYTNNTADTSDYGEPFGWELLIETKDEE